MEFTSIQDILKFALSKEEASVQFYRDLASQMEDASTRSLFEILIKNEQKHIAALRLEIEKLGHIVPINPDESDSKYQWDERLEMDSETRKMDFIEALELAIQKERAAFRLYTKVLGTNQNPALEKVLMELAEEEMRHVLQLEREYDGIINRNM